MKHAGPQELAELTDLLEAVRAQPEVTEPRPGYFYCQTRSLTHFHTDPTGLYADVRIGKNWSRMRVSAAQERADFLQLLTEEIRARGRNRGSISPPARGRD